MRTTPAFCPPRCQARGSGAPGEGPDRGPHARGSPEADPGAAAADATNDADLPGTNPDAPAAVQQLQQAQQVQQAQLSTGRSPPFLGRRRPPRARYPIQRLRPNPNVANPAISVLPDSPDAGGQRPVLEKPGRFPGPRGGSRLSAAIDPFATANISFGRRTKFLSRGGLRGLHRPALADGPVSGKFKMDFGKQNNTHTHTWFRWTAHCAGARCSGTKA